MIAAADFKSLAEAIKITGLQNSSKNKKAARKLILVPPGLEPGTL
jgi:hypothetical protein